VVNGGHTVYSGGPVQDFNLIPYSLSAVLKAPIYNILNFSVINIIQYILKYSC